MTEICGCRDSDERMAEVEREHKEKIEKEAQKRKESAERAQEEADMRRRVAMEGLKQRDVLSQMHESYNNSLAASSGNLFFISGTASVNIMSAVFSRIEGGRLL